MNLQERLMSRSPVAMLAALVLLAGLVLAGSPTAHAATPAPGWLVTVTPSPSQFAPGSSTNHLHLRLHNVGGDATSGSFTVSDVLPPELTPTAIEGSAAGESGGLSATGCTLVPLECTYSSSVPRGGVVVVDITVSAGLSAGAFANTVTVTGGGAATATRTTNVSAGSGTQPFGLVDHQTVFVDEAGAPVTQAGAQPWAQITNLLLSQTGGRADDAVKEIRVALPAGFAGNPEAAPKCPRANFRYDEVTATPSCPVASQVGTSDAQVRIFGTTSDQIAPVYNLEPPEGYVADFGFLVVQVPVHVLIRVRSESDYGLEAIIPNISSSVELLGSTLTLWGVPADATHDAQRYFGTSPYATGAASGAPRTPFLTMPTQCSGHALDTVASASAWTAPDTFRSLRASAPAVTGCEGLVFNPSVSVTPDTTRADTPSGYEVNVHVPQNATAGRLATPNLRKAVVALPEGVSLSPAVADGLVACTDAQSGFGRAGAASCPIASQIGTVQIDTPVLPGPLKGTINIGTQEAGDPFRIFLLTEGYGVTIRLKGSIAPDPATGRLVTTFDDAPQLPFSDLTLRFKGGGRAPLANPATCGTKTTTSALTSWAGGAAATPGDAFDVSWDGAGAPCPAAAPFAPAVSAGSAGAQAGAFSPFTLTVTREDREQELSTIAADLPAGLLGLVASVPLCGEAAATAGTCGESSRVGSSTVAAGAGPQPLTLTGGRVFLAGPYKGAPFSLSIVVPTQAGPYDLGTVVVRAPIVVDAARGTLSVKADALPRILLGVPLRLRRVTITLDRARFMFNPTSCAATAVTATLGSTAGATFATGSRFQAGGCGDLPFAPQLTASTAGRTTTAKGASLKVHIGFTAGQANLRSVAVRLPSQLGPRLKPTVNGACPQAQFDRDPSGCPAVSLVGTAKAVTPVLVTPLAGPVRVVQVPGKLPKLVLSLSGGGVSLTLVGAITAEPVTNMIIATFNGIPDVPLSSFDLDLPQGPHSVLEGIAPLCGKSVTLGVAIAGQNGKAVRAARQPVAVTGCPVKATNSVTGSVVKVKVLAPAKGRITVSGAGLATARRSAAKAGSYTVTTKLTAKARRTLARRGRLTVKVRVAFLAGGKRTSQKTTTTATFRVPGGR